MGKQVSCPVCDWKWEVVERCPCDGWELGEKWVLTPDPEAYERAYRERLERAREGMAQFKAGALGLGEEGLQNLRERLRALGLEPGPALADWARQNRPEPRTNEGAKVVDGRPAGRRKGDDVRLRRIILLLLLDLPIYPPALPILALALISPALGIDPIVGGRLVLLLTFISTIRAVWRRRWRRSVLWVILGVPWGTLAFLAPKWAIFWGLGVQAAVLRLFEGGVVLPHHEPLVKGLLVASMFVNLALGARLVVGEWSLLPTVGVTAVVAGFLLGVRQRVYLLEELLISFGVVAVAVGLIGHFQPELFEAPDPLQAVVDVPEDQGQEAQLPELVVSDDQGQEAQLPELVVSDDHLPVEGPGRDHLQLIVLGLIAVITGAVALFNEGASERELKLIVSRYAKLTMLCGYVALTAGLVETVRPVLILVGSIFIAVAALLFLTVFQVARPGEKEKIRGMLGFTLIMFGTVGVASALVWKFRIWAAVGSVLGEPLTALPEVLVAAFNAARNTLQTAFETFAPVLGIELVAWLVVLIAYKVGASLWLLIRDAE